ncbi:hypothetical protein GQ53DRAFT_648360 [Thozetella sp. PMI_491]|nr:hypothetical protein GQ53DRAFT_648360 [Thozetella sp. PMI_491]
MPKPNVAITTPIREALLECFSSITRLKTEDVDVAAPPAALIDIWEGVSAGALNFSLESDGKIVFDAPQGFRVRVNIIEIGNGCIEHIYVTEPFLDGSVASVSDLLLLRAVTVIDRGSDGDAWDFTWLLAEAARKGNFPAIGEEELECLCRAGESCLGRLSRLVIAAILGGNNEAAAMRLLQ